MQSTILAQIIQAEYGNKLKNVQILNLSNHKINRIGFIPHQVASQVRVLNLQNNNLKNIDQILQFTSLQTLDLSYNKISSDKSILSLKNLISLKTLFLKGNPFLQNPLNQQTLSFISSFNNDLQILNVLFENKEREILVEQHRKNKNLNRISSNGQLKRNQSRQSINLPRNIQVNKHIQKSKVSMLLSNMEEFIQQKHQSQQISNQSVDGGNSIQQQGAVEYEKLQFPVRRLSQITPIKKSPRFGQFYANQNIFSEINETNKFQEESTNIKIKNYSKQKIVGLQSGFSSNIQSQNYTNDKFTSQKQKKINQSLSSDFKKSPQKEFKYQVDNLKIKMELDNNTTLNYPSIIEKQDQDSYQIQFDFMSPKKLKDSRKKEIIKKQPCNQLKSIASSYVKIDQGENTQRKEEQKIIKQPGPNSVRSQNSKISIKASSIFQSLNYNKTNLDQSQQKSIFKKYEKQNVLQNRQPHRQQPMVSKKGSLHQSTRHLLPQTNKSTAYDVINRLLNIKANQSISFSFNNSISQMIENGQKFQRFYYTSLTRLKPLFNLLYSPFQSLKPQQKDMLLQQLFKNHKQIFILFIRQFHERQKRDQQIEIKNQSIQLLKNKIQQRQHKIYQQQQNKQQLHKKLQLSFNQNQQLKQYIHKLQQQNNKLHKEANKFEDILDSREKIINDVKLQYQKTNKIVTKKDLIISKFMKDDQIQQEIQYNHQKAIKKIYLNLIKNKANKVMKLHKFEDKRKYKQMKRQQKDNKQLKNYVFYGFKLNYKRQKDIKAFIKIKQKNALNQWFNEWKIQSHLNKLQQKVINLYKQSLMKQFIQKLNRNNLKIRRNNKIKDFIQIRLKKKSYFKGFKQNYLQYKSKQQQLINKAVKFYQIKYMKKYFNKFKCLKSIVQQKINQNQIKIKPLLMKHQFNLFIKIIKYKQKQLQHKTHIFNQYIKTNETKLFFVIFKNSFIVHSKSTKKLKQSLNFKKLKLFNLIKSITHTKLQKYLKFKPLIRKIAHQYRIKYLVTQFKQNQILSKYQKLKKQQFMAYFKQYHLLNSDYKTKKTQLSNYLTFRRGFKSKNIFISQLRHLAQLTKINKKQKTLQQHYKLQQQKYKQTYQLNMYTLNQLKTQINTYINQIQFYKIQVQKLSQRQLFILQQKQNCLIQIQSRQEENQELKIMLIQNQKKLQEVNNKYQKSLDMYANLIHEMNLEGTKIKTSFLYDTITGSRQPNTFRKQQTKFTSLKKSKQSLKM